MGSFEEVMAHEPLSKKSSSITVHSGNNKETGAKYSSVDTVYSANTDLY